MLHTVGGGIGPSQQEHQAQSDEQFQIVLPVIQKEEQEDEKDEHISRVQIVQFQAFQKPRQPLFLRLFFLRSLRRLRGAGSVWLR